MDAGGARSDPAFPRLHIRPERGWLNDPNGLSYVDGVYHVFFQHNPDSARHHAIRWGHASSTDLITWREEPIALVPRAGQPDAFGCWSGVVTIDRGVPTAVYSGVLDPHGHSQVLLAHSDRTMRHWVQESEPVAGMPADERVTHARDPFVLDLDGHRWAVQGAGLANGTSALLAYACDDLHSWSYRGLVLTSDHPLAAAHAPAEVWECPQLVRVDGTWVLIISPVLRDRPTTFGRVAWFTGDLQVRDRGLVFEPATGGLLDLGPDFYAPQVLTLPDRVLLWGWTWEGSMRAPDEVDAAGWAGALTFPRELRIVDGAVVCVPASELVGLRRRTLYDGVAPASPVEVASPAFEVAVSAGPEPSDVRLGLGADRAVVTVSVPAGRGARLFVDGSVVEVLVESEATRTLRAYPHAHERWSVAASSRADLTIWALGPSHG